MKIKFDGNQEYQLNAVSAVAGLFRDLPSTRGISGVPFERGGGEFFGEFGVGNQLTIEEAQILQNLRATQRANGISESSELDGMNFSVEMETGTGKTYVYLRTIFELEREYGFKKFIIVVPSVAIREGVLKSIELTRDHFSEIYGDKPMAAWVYNSKRVFQLRRFSQSSAIQILIINIDSFNKASNNVIYQDNERLAGRKPIEFIQATRPLLIIDEPQNMESERSRESIENLGPLATFRYSATHRNPYNLVYRLTPVDAFDLKLVKRIEVDSVTEGQSFNRPYIRVKSIKALKSQITAKLEIDVKQATGYKRKVVSVRNRSDLLHLSGMRENYRDYIVNRIDAGRGLISFRNGVMLNEGDTHDGYTDNIMREQIRRTVLRHLEKELDISNSYFEGRRVKILSLFFIDRVANYASETGKLRQWFIEAYEEYMQQSRYENLALPPVDLVHSGYFAQDRGMPRDTTGVTKADEEAYALIMRDKERLLSLDEPLRFIFSHSALREGWDNPNVFQICTLNETHSEMKKRQEIGRGLRLPVTETGERCHDAKVNILTVLANESYDDFASKLQSEIEEECGVEFKKGWIENARERRTAKLKKGWQLDHNFLELWERIKHRTRYSVEYSSEDLIKRSTAALSSMEPVVSPIIHVRTAGIEMSEEGVRAKFTGNADADFEFGAFTIPDLVGYLQQKTELTRVTLAEILVRSNTLDTVSANPQQYLDQAEKAIKRVLQDIIIDGIKYERIEGSEYEMSLFEQNEITSYISKMVEVENSIYDSIEFDSDVEKRFAEGLDRRRDIKLFIKLPRWFKVETPVGDYNPDWAIVKQPEGEDAKLYLVRETKGATDLHKLRPDEANRIRCGKVHFQELGVDFKHITSPEEV